MKILQLASGDLWAGAEVQLFTLCRQLASFDDVDLHVVLLNDGQLAQRLRACNIKVDILDESMLGFPGLVRGLYRLCCECRPNLVHSHRSKQNVLASLCGLALRIPSLRTIHGADEFRSSAFSVGGLVQFLNRFTGRWLQRSVVAVSEDLAHNLRIDYGAGRVVVVRNGVVEQDIADHNTIVLDNTGRDNEVHVGIVGRLTPVKRIDLFLEAAQLLLRGQPELIARFHVVGDGELLDPLRDMAESLGISERVEFTGHVESAVPYLKAFDVLVMCSDHEGTPMTLLEAMLCELPIVAHDTGGLAELLEDGKAGRLVSRHEATAYAEAIIAAITDRDGTAALARYGREKVLKEYSAAANATAYRDLYRATLAR